MWNTPFLLLSFFFPFPFFLHLVTLSFSLPLATSFDCEGCTPKSISGLLAVCVVYRDNIGRRLAKERERGRELRKRARERERRTCDEGKKDSQWKTVKERKKELRVMEERTFYCFKQTRDRIIQWTIYYYAMLLCYTTLLYHTTILYYTTLLGVCFWSSSSSFSFLRMMFRFNDWSESWWWWFQREEEKKEEKRGQRNRG